MERLTARLAAAARRRGLSYFGYLPLKGRRRYMLLGSMVLFLGSYLTLATSTIAVALRRDVASGGRSGARRREGPAPRQQRAAAAGTRRTRTSPAALRGATGAYSQIGVLGPLRVA